MSSSSETCETKRKTIEQVLAAFKLQQNAENNENRNGIIIESMKSIAPRPTSEIHEGKNESFVILQILVDDIYKVGHLAIDWIEDAESGKRYSDAIPAETKEKLLAQVPMALCMIPQLENHALVHVDEFSAEFPPPWGKLGAYAPNSLQEYVPRNRLLRVQCYNNVFIRPKTKETQESAFFMWRMPRLTAIKPIAK